MNIITGFGLIAIGFILLLKPSRTNQNLRFNIPYTFEGTIFGAFAIMLGIAYILSG